MSSQGKAAIATLQSVRFSGHEGAVLPTVSAPVRRFSMGGRDIAAIVAPGHRRPVLLLHGNSSSKAVWARQIPLLLEQGRGVLAPDLPGHGDSDDAQDPETTYSFPGYAAAIGGVLDALGWNAVDVVGWSLGGHIGLELLATDRRIQKLLIVGTPPIRPCPEALEQAFYGNDDMNLAGKPSFSSADALAYATAMMGGTDQLTPELLAAAARTDGRARACMFANGLRGVGADQRATVERSDKPLCVVHGNDEPFVRLDYLRAIKYRALWNKRIHVIADAGHAPHWQSPSVFNDLLRAFLTFGEPQHASNNEIPIANFHQS
jgi:pimeloyl-ACP methyl ester carboxylesterase